MAKYEVGDVFKKIKSCDCGCEFLSERYMPVDSEYEIENVYEDFIDNSSYKFKNYEYYCYDDDYLEGYFTKVTFAPQNLEDFM